MNFLQFDSRRVSVLRHRADLTNDEADFHEFENYMTCTKQMLARAIVEGIVFLISIDDSDIDYQNVYEPDFKEYASKECFPQELLNPAQFRNPKVNF